MDILLKPAHHSFFEIWSLWKTALVIILCCISYHSNYILRTIFSCRKYGRFHMIIRCWFTIYVFKSLPWWCFRYLMFFSWCLHETMFELYIMAAICERTLLLTVLPSVNCEVWGLCGIVSFYCWSDYRLNLSSLCPALCSFFFLFF